ECRGAICTQGRPASGTTRPELRRCGTLSDRFGRLLPVPDHQARSVPVEEPSQRVAPGTHPLLAVRAGVHATTGDTDVLPRRSAVLPGSDLQLDPRRTSPATARVAVRP